jgi:chemotaxis protein MotA
LRLLDQPGALGVGIATAFVATIYGVGIANLLFFPLAARLRERHESRMRKREALADALVALAAHESPVAISRHFNERVAAFEAASKASHGANR